MNYKTLIVGAIVIFVLAIIAAFTIPNLIDNKYDYQDYDDSYTDESEEHEETYENEDEDKTVDTEENQIETPYGDKGGDSTIQTPVETAANSYTIAEVATHKTSDSCWTAISGQVYDLTPFIERHPGGAANIMRLCGIDGTATFTAQHGGQSQPENTLADYLIGSLI